METDAFKYFPMTSSRSFPSVERSASSVSWPEIVTWYCLSLFMMLWAVLEADLCNIGQCHHASCGRGKDDALELVDGIVLVIPVFHLYA